jgi:hypothetical protein
VTALNEPTAAGGVGDREPLDPDRLKHVEFIQAAIIRLGNNSFLIKGWALTLAAGFLALSSSRMSWEVAASGVVPLLCFWFLDGYFLRQERLFRRLYDDARRPDSSVEVLSMNVAPYLSENPLRAAILSGTLVLFHGALVTANLAFVVISL